jgi:serine/threonine-protein kinase
MVHLDVTPPNIMLKDNGKAVLIDFGIAGEMAPPSSFSRSFGNKAFAPYELYRRGSRHPTVDVYCLAASLYYAVTGQCPTKSFDRKYDGEELVPPQRWVSGISDGLNQAILQGMALEAKYRPQSIEAWLALLTPYESDTDDLSSEVGVDYRRLRDLLKAGKWQEADEETAVVMCKAANREKAGWLTKKDIKKFPCTDLRTIDRLWVKYSNGRFGFSVQKRIWESVGGTPDADYDYETYCRFGDKVGWRVKEEWLEYRHLTFRLNAPTGHLPLGWGGGYVEVWWRWVVGGVCVDFRVISSLASRLVECNI